MRGHAAMPAVRTAQSGRRVGLLWFSEGSNLAASTTSGGHRHRQKSRAKDRIIGQLVHEGLCKNTPGKDASFLPVDNALMFPSPTSISTPQSGSSTLTFPRRANHTARKQSSDQINSVSSTAFHSTRSLNLAGRPHSLGVSGCTGRASHALKTEQRTTTRTDGRTAFGLQPRAIHSSAARN